MLLRHYRAVKEFELSKIAPIENITYHNKPSGGLWTSPVNSNYGWVHWCEQEEYSATPEYVDLEFHGRLLVVDGIYDLSKLPIARNGDLCTPTVLFEELLQDYDGIHLTEDGQWATRYADLVDLYGWDCESVLVFNPCCLTIV